MLNRGGRQVRLAGRVRLILAATYIGISFGCTVDNHLVLQDGQTISDKPSLVVVISVDQFSADLFTEYRPHFVGGLERLSTGVVFPQAYQSHAVTETCPGHATILTGSRPARTGIVGNIWVNHEAPREDKIVNCAEDESRPNTHHRDYEVSTVHLRVPTLGDRMKAKSGRARVIAVAGKDRSAVMMGGKTADQTWWLAETGYTSFSGVIPPVAVEVSNEDFRHRLGRSAEERELPEFCKRKEFVVEVTEDISVGAGRFARGADDFSAFRASPEQDEATLQLALALVDEMQLGQRPETDLMAIGLSGTDKVGHTFGTAGAEMCIQVVALDRLLGEFFESLEKRSIDFLVVLTADHGGHDIPERHRQTGMPMAQRVDPALEPAALTLEIARVLRIDDVQVIGDSVASNQYIVGDLSEADRTRVLSYLLDRVGTHPQVEAVFTKQQIANEPSPKGAPESWSLLQKVRANFDYERSGDYFVALKPRVMSISTPSKGWISMHGSPWGLDRRVPLMFWRQGIVGFEQPLGVETVDILPTIAPLIDLEIDQDEIDGRCLDLISGANSSCVEVAKSN